MNTLSKELMDSLFVFNNDGTIEWRENRGKAKKGEKVSSLTSKGYLRIRLYGKQFRVHRLVYAYHTGEWPEIIDHINRVRTDNRIENLRAVTLSGNSVNSNACYNRYGYRGVGEHRGKYRAVIKKDGKRYTSTVFDTPREAHTEYLRLREQIFPGVVGQ